MPLAAGLLLPLRPEHRTKYMKRNKMARASAASGVAKMDPPAVRRSAPHWRASAASSSIAEKSHGVHSHPRC